MKLKVKICGMKDPGNIMEVAKLEPDMMGFIFYKSSIRYVGDVFNPEVIHQLPQGIKKTGVFVNADLFEIEGKIWKYSLDIIQLHGDESPETCKQLINSGIKVIKAFKITNEDSFKNCIDYISCTDYFLFDSKNGGSGNKFDWKLLVNYPLGHPFFLSGGISEDDVSEIKKINNPAFSGIDLNSRFEINPGLKDIKILKKFISELYK